MGKQRRIAKNPLHVLPHGVQQDADSAGTGHFPFHALEKAEADTEPGQLIWLGARTAATAIGLARARAGRVPPLGKQGVLCARHRVALIGEAGMRAEVLG